MEVIGHKHVILSILSVAILTSVWTMVRRSVGAWLEGLRTIFVLSNGLQNFSYGHPDLLIYQPI